MPSFFICFFSTKKGYAKEYPFLYDSDKFRKSSCFCQSGSGHDALIGVLAPDEITTGAFSAPHWTGEKDMQVLRRIPFSHRSCPPSPFCMPLWHRQR